MCTHQILLCILLLLGSKHEINWKALSIQDVKQWQMEVLKEEITERINP
jgi:hypothetical protein